ncbi:hypothetical protein BOX15_Mlig019988g1 [Macrostomum lignano]|uniref:Uncharacterized protein n=1 Tax=Macrostomum lignano TaxID=282301 RepID=A0A267GF18_9PLAT|nr:hypothetical protein BOX15_Mlig019988g1 [Macrostomum lignano]
MARRPSTPTTIMPKANLRPAAELYDNDIDIMLRELVLLTSNSQQTIHWLATYGLLQNSWACEQCPKALAMWLQRKDGAQFVDGYAWACPTCRTQKSIT